MCLLLTPSVRKKVKPCHHNSFRPSSGPKNKWFLEKWKAQLPKVLGMLQIYFHKAWTTHLKSLIQGRNIKWHSQLPGLRFIDLWSLMATRYNQFIAFLKNCFLMDTYYFEHTKEQNRLDFWFQNTCINRELHRTWSLLLSSKLIKVLYSSLSGPDSLNVLLKSAFDNTCAVFSPIRMKVWALELLCQRN